MQLRPRVKTESYIYAKGDFAILESKQTHYGEFFSTHPIYPEVNFQKAKEKIENEWHDIPKAGGGRSKDSDLENLYRSYDQVRYQDLMQRDFINMMFKRVYDYFDEIIHDTQLGYLTTKQLETYLTYYQQAIEKNKELKINSWNKPPIERIEKKIAEVLSKTNN